MVFNLTWSDLPGGHDDSDNKMRLVHTHPSPSEKGCGIHQNIWLCANPLKTLHRASRNRWLPPAYQSFEAYHSLLPGMRNPSARSLQVAISSNTHPCMLFILSRRDYNESYELGNRREGQGYHLWLVMLTRRA